MGIVCLAVAGMETVSQAMAENFTHALYSPIKISIPFNLVYMFLYLLRLISVYQWLFVLSLIHI